MDTLETAFLMFIGFMLGCAITAVVMANSWEKDAIRAGAAHYEKKHGNFVWNGDVKNDDN